MRSPTVFLLAAMATLNLSAGIQGMVEDETGSSVSGVQVEVFTAAGTKVGGAVSGPDGRYAIDAGWPGLRLRALMKGFARFETVAEAGEQRIRLRPAAVNTSITVTETPGQAGNPTELTAVTFVAAKDRLAERPASTLGHALEQEPSVLVQQTGPGQVSPFLRGLTGYQVLNLIDGVRFNNSTFRSGPNQYLALVEPSQAERVEGMLGPSGAQYGSDGLGGTIQVLTEPVRFVDDAGWTAHGEVSLAAEAADLGAGAGGEVSFGSRRVWMLLGAGGYRHNTMRTGGGEDSRNALFRYFGLEPGMIRQLIGDRIPDTAWSRAGAQAKFAWRPADRHVISGWYQRGSLMGIKNVKDLWSGLGRLQADFSPQTLDLGYLRWEGLRLLSFDSMSARFSVNRQVDGNQRRNLRLTDSLIEEDNRVLVQGYAWQGVTHLGSHTALTVGTEYYGERVSSSRLTNSTPGRPLYPDGSEYGTFGAAVQGATELGRQLRAGYGVRFTRIGYSNPANPAFGTPESSQSFRDWTWNANLLWKANRFWGLHAGAGRGFRAPNLNDLGAIGLNDLGYEIPVAEAAASQPLLADSAGEGALSKGVPARALTVESLLNVEAGLRLNFDRVEARIQVFNAQLEDPIVRRTLLFNRSNAPSQLAGLPVTVIQPTAAQAAQGVVTVATAFDPRAVKAFVNDGRAVYRGIESLLRWRISSQWSFRATYSYLGGHEMDPNRNHRRLSPQLGNAALRYAGSRGWWLEAGFLAAGPQTRLSGGDRDDERIGASRSRNDIASFFNGARIAPYLDAQRRFAPTGETLEQIQNRVLPGIANNVRVPLYTSTAGWLTPEIRGGLPLGERWSLMAAITNLLDRNYRVHGSGLDGPGLSAYARLLFTF